MLEKTDEAKTNQKKLGFAKHHNSVISGQ